MATTAVESTTNPEKPAVPQAIQSPSQRNKAAVLAEMESEGIGPSAKEPEKAPPKALRTTEEPAKEEPTEEPEDDEEPDKVEAKTEDEPDEETDKGLERIKAAEKRMRMDLAKEKEDLHREMAKERDEHKTQMAEAKEKLSKFERLSARALSNPAAVLLELGVPKDKLQAVSQLIYLSSPESEKDPKYKDHATRMAKEMEYEEKMRALEEKQTKMEEDLKKKEESSKVEQAISTYMDGVVKTVSPETPLVHRLHEKSPQQARADLRQIAEVMADEHHKQGTTFEPADVVRMLERIMLDELDEAGVDTAQFKKAAPKAPETKKPTPKEQEKQALANVAQAKRGHWRDGRSEMLSELEKL